MAEHVDIQNANCHEPKHITDGVTGDSGKVITNSSTTTGESEYRKLKAADIQNKQKVLNVHIPDVSTAGSVWVVSPVAGDIDEVYSVIDGAIATSDCTLTVKIGGVAVTGGTLVIIQAGSAAGDTVNESPSGAKTVTAGQAIEIQTDGASTNTVTSTLTLLINETA
jgi:hypothetical protein